MTMKRVKSYVDSRRPSLKPCCVCTVCSALHPACLVGSIDRYVEMAVHIVHTRRVYQPYSMLARLGQMLRIGWPSSSLGL